MSLTPDSMRDIGEEFKQEFENNTVELRGATGWLSDKEQTQMTHRAVEALLPLLANANQEKRRLEANGFPQEDLGAVCERYILTSGQYVRDTFNAGSSVEIVTPSIAHC